MSEAMREMVVGFVGEMLQENPEAWEGEVMEAVLGQCLLGSSSEGGVCALVDDLVAEHERKAGEAEA